MDEGGIGQTTFCVDCKRQEVSIENHVGNFRLCGGEDRGRKVKVEMVNRQKVSIAGDEEG